MAYIVPKVLIKQEFTQLPVFSDNPLSALVFGPQFELHRYSVAAEKPSTAVTHPDTPALKNKYQSAADVTYNFPNQTVGTYVDADFTKVTFDNARVEYYPNAELGSTAGTAVRVAHPTIGSTYYSNRFKTSSLVLKTANDVDRSVDFSNRNVSPGDYVVLKNDDTTEETTVRIKALHATRSSASLGSGTEDDDNKNNQSEDYNDAAVYVNPGSNGTVDTGPSNTSTAYKGHASKRILSDTYTAEVTTPGDLSTCRFKITSANGAFAAKTNVALVTGDVLNLDTSNNNVVRLDFTAIERGSGPLLQLGDKWTLAVVAPVAVQTPTSSGTYTGTQDLVYKLTVVRGGPFYSGSNGDVCAKIAVTSDGDDSSAAVNVASATAFKVGTHGAEAAFSTATNNGGLILNDAYYIVATAAKDAAVNIVETYEKLPATLLSAAEDYQVISLQYPATIDVPAVNPIDEDLVNWVVDADAQTITINQGITTVNSDIVYSGGDTISLDVKTADIFVTHRDLVVTNATSISSISNSDQVAAVLGTVHPDNPLAQGVYNAALNSNGAPVYFAGVQTNDLAGYEEVLSLSRKKDATYGFVPLTFDRTIQDAVVSHVNALSTPELAKWRLAWLSTPIVESSLVYDTDEDGAAWKATVTDDPFATGTQYRLVTMAGAAFLTDGVRIGDKFLINFRTTPAGKVESDEYLISEIRTETTLVLASGPSAAVNVAQKAQIKRVFTKDEQIDKLAAVGGDYNNRRVRMVFPPTVKNGDVQQDGYQVAAALAGLRSGVVPHQGLTNTVLLGFTDLTLAVETYSDIQLNRLAEAGLWIVTQSAVGATPYVRHQLTTDTENLNTSEDSITTNVDSISYGMQRALEPYVGKYNIHPNAIVAIRRAIDNELRFRATNTYTVRAGNQLISYEIVKLEQDPTFRDRLVVEVTLNVPYPLNFINLTFFV